MPHLSRLLAVVCAITVILVSLPSYAGIGDKDLPLLNGQKTKLLYTVVGVMDDDHLTTVFNCASTERRNGKTIEIGIEVFDKIGWLINEIAVGEGTISVAPGHHVTLNTRGTLAFDEDENINTGGVINQGSARIFATSKNVLCSAMIVEIYNNPPTSMVMLPVFRMTKQGGMLNCPGFAGGSIP